VKKSHKWSLVSNHLIVYIFFFQAIAFAEEVPTLEKRRDILKLLEVSGLLAQMDYIKDGVINPYSRMISLTYPKVPDPFWKELNKLIGKKEMDVLMDRIVLVYNKHMSHEAIKQLIKMFSTSFWEEWKQKMPTISNEAGLIGSQWTQELTQSKKLKHKLDSLVKKYNLEKLNSKPETSH
ncbi:uncharacterized protein METZ01_LOCUS422202, partial [marine metagenome]